MTSIFNLVKPDGRFWLTRDDIKIPQPVGGDDRTLTTVPLGFGPKYNSMPLLPTQQHRPQYKFQTSRVSYPTKIIKPGDNKDSFLLVKPKFIEKAPPVTWYPNSVFDAQNNVYPDGLPKAQISGNSIQSSTPLSIPAEPSTRRHLERLREEYKSAVDLNNLREADRLEQQIQAYQRRHFPKEYEHDVMQSHLEELKALKSSSNNLRFSSDQHAMKAEKSRQEILEELKTLKGNGTVSSQKGRATMFEIPPFKGTAKGSITVPSVESKGTTGLPPISETTAPKPLTGEPFDLSSTPSTAGSTLGVQSENDVNTFFTAGYPTFDSAEYKDVSDYIMSNKVAPKDKPAAARYYLDVLSALQDGAKISARSDSGLKNFYRQGILKAVMIENAVKLDDRTINDALARMSSKVFIPEKLAKEARNALVSLGKLKVRVK